MSKIAANQFRSIERVLEKECGLQELYLELLDEERLHITKFNSDKLQSVLQKRDDVCRRIAELRDERLALMRELPEGETLKLTEILQKYSPGTHESRRILAMAERLKLLVSQSTRQSKEFNQVVNFSLNLVNGAITTIWSASQASKSYGPRGVIKETPSLANQRSVVARQA